MSALRMPQHLADPAHIDSGEAHLRFELLEEIDGSVGRAERRVEQTLAALRAHDAAGPEAGDRAPLLAAAVAATWRLIVQHEACDCADHRLLIERFGIPLEVLARLGPG